ncbi:HAD family hydrolase [Corynebacterium sp. sy017]|uniref:HAD-IA family hydrolase n=1 Tax=unclassified Corynebacterium TaxID=2624378 RepID=UPI001185B00F|nr:MULTISPECIES: HAD-IA family hydrolase [unclassified Corynebacterium]MBP3087899.1 HAD family hydrolase [Corynebacterium sp. sy017]QDZ42867.1 HAD-IA family hydrolase [Corynebacterium sp. sy039]TSD92440.1 HAD family hydrolase [Corynebacterium sp. SY003]
MYRLAIFDMAGTTVDERDEVYRVLRTAAEREGARISDEVFQSYMGTEKYWALGQLLEIGGVPLNKDIHERAWQWFRAELRRSYMAEPPSPFAGIETMFCLLREKGIKIALTTGFSREIADLILEAMGWNNGVIDCLVAGDEVPLGRPEPFLIEKAMQELGVSDLKEVISCGDTQADVESAQRAGVTSVGVLTGHLDREKFGSFGADFVLDSAAQLPLLLADPSDEAE